MGRAASGAAPSFPSGPSALPPAALLAAHCCCFQCRVRAQPSPAGDPPLGTDKSCCGPGTHPGTPAPGSLSCSMERHPGVRHNVPIPELWVGCRQSQCNGLLLPALPSPRRASHTALRPQVEGLSLRRTLEGNPERWKLFFLTRGGDCWLALPAARWSWNTILIYKQFNLRNAAKCRMPNPALCGLP